MQPLRLARPKRLAGSEACSIATASHCQAARPSSAPAAPGSACRHRQDQQQSTCRRPLLPVSCQAEKAFQHMIELCFKAVEGPLVQAPL